MFFRCILFVSVMVSGWGNVAAQQRAVHSLDGSWLLQVDGQDDWQTVQVPGTFEDQIAIGFDGVATFRKQIDAISIGKHRRLHLERPSFRVEAQLPKVTEPTRMILRAVALDDEENLVAENAWPIWVLPAIDPLEPLIIHPSGANSIEDITGLEKVLGWENADREQAKHHRVVLTAELNDEILEWLESGGNVILLCNDQPNSLPLQKHWFLRGGPVVSQTCAEIFPRDMLIELQHFDLADRVVRDVSYLDDIDPMLMLWEAHDLDHIKTNGLLFHMPVGQSGNLILSALQHGGRANAVGSYLLKKMAMEAATGRIAELDDAARGMENLRRIRNELNQRKIMLDKVEWKFKTDADEKGKSEKWFARELDDAAWSTIKTDRHWESQGFDQLDNWAWYRLDVAIPADWDSKETYLNFTGVDDYYDLYVNGERVGFGGDIERRETAFELRTSHDISDHVKVGETVQITVAVYDWYGAGGIFRPVWISSQPLSDEPRILK